MDFYEELLKARKENKMYATATVVKTEGSTPRSAGSKMLVYADGSVVGTVGGGVVERQALTDCKTAMKTGETMLKTEPQSHASLWKSIVHYHPHFLQCGN